jgi:hypothetical protein
VGAKAADAAVERIIPMLETQFEAKLDIAKAAIKIKLTTELAKHIDDFVSARNAAVEEHLRAR